MNTPPKAIKAPAAPPRPFLLLSPGEASNPALVAMLRQSGCTLRVQEKVGGPSVPVDEWLKR